MNHSNQLPLALQSVSFACVLLVISFMLLSHIGVNGIYTYTILGALYEILWLPLVAGLFGLPLVWFVLAFMKKISWKQLCIPTVLLLGTSLYLLLIFP